MKKKNHHSNKHRSKKGIALVTVLFLMSLLMVLVVTMVLLSRSENRSANNYANQINVDSLGQIATNLVISQVRTATNQAGEAWASQPGAIRKYDLNGDFVAGYKLYSDDDMIITDEDEFFDDLPDSKWAEQTEHYVDLNEPISVEGKAIFPILDPRAEESVEGFSFDTSIDGTIRASDETARLPMPTRWLYMLQDGTTGHLDPGDGKFVGFRPNGSAVTPTKENPIVGRIAFWTDDETSKININTASEPTFWDSPRSVSLDDIWYARSQPNQKEYQRYPGHPATTALSTVLFGNQIERKTLSQLDGGEMRQQRRPSVRMTKNKDIKEAIYDIVPRVNTGGSAAGTVVNTGDQGVERDEDHLYVSIDEFAFKVPRIQASEDARETSEIVDRELLEKSRFFLTAHSRAPELNLFGLPRISIWPTDSDTKAYSHLTEFDKLIRFCSTGPGGERYFFTRQNSLSPTEDWSAIPRNREVYDYLKKLTSENFPAVGENFASKFGADHEQVLTEIFDYIRTTNLCDDSHPKLFYTGAEQWNHTQFTPGRTISSSGAENNYGTHWAHGQVAPIRINDTQGFGRFPTISECSFLFICSADPGDPTDDPSIRGRTTDDVGGRTTPSPDRVDYTNFPPMNPVPTAAILANPATTVQGLFPMLDENGTLRDVTDILHPAYQPRYWNHALELWRNWNTGTESTACKPDERVLSFAFLPEAFVPSQGWSGHNSYSRMVVEGLDGITLNGEPIHIDNRLADPSSITRDLLGNLSSGFHGRAWGGPVGVRRTTWYRFTSEPLKISNVARGTVSFKATKPIVIKLYTDRSSDAANLVQTITLDFPDAEFPIPEIQKTGTFDRNGNRDSFARNWWNFNSRITRDNAHYGSVLINGQKDSIARANSIPENDTDNPLFGAVGEGRLNMIGDNPSSPWNAANNNSPDTATRNPNWHQGPHSGAIWKNGDVVRSLTSVNQGTGRMIGGDTRLVAMKHVVDSDEFVPHYSYFDTNERLDHTINLPAGAHYYIGFSNADLHNTSDGLYPAFSYSVDTQLTDAEYHFSKFPDFPRGAATSATNRQEFSHILTGDFDNGVAITPDGAFVNKPDGGNRSDRFGVSRSFNDIPTPYFDSNWNQAVQGPAYFSPNRQINSPVMFGSLPTGVKRDIPWQTLLFRPQPWGNHSNFNQPHPGHEGIKDHYLLDLFWMPVVEPYAISEPFSTAGKINLNYQILPFTNIKRATGIHAVMKSEEMLIVSDEDAAHYKNWDHALADYYEPPLPEDVHLRQLIEIDETLKQFDDRFLNGKIFKSASEICEVHLVPLQDQSGQTQLTLPTPSAGSEISDQVDNIMKAFWEDHSPTGDNSRERPYSNLYPRLTTKSNTYRVHVRAQIVKKAIDSDPDTFDPSKDNTAGEWRGSTLIERFIDPNNEDIPDYVNDTSLIGNKTLDQYYRYRIIYRKRFDG